MTGVAPERRSALPSSAGAGPRSRGTVLIVEDSAINQVVAKAMLAQLGYGSDVAADGIEALDALERRSYDAILMDCHMPHMDGFQATGEIRRREAGERRVPILAMTASTVVEDREKCISAGMDDYLAKPAKLHELEDMLDRWLPGGDTPPGEAGAPVGADEVLDMEQLDGLGQLRARSGDPSLLSEWSSSTSTELRPG